MSLKTPDSSPSLPSFSSLPRNLSNADSTESEPHVKASEIYKVLQTAVSRYDLVFVPMCVCECLFAGAIQVVSGSVGAVRVEDAEKLARKAGVRTENICGAKAASCCRLASLAAQFDQGKVIHSC